jgi:hypothetical protein
MTTAEQIVAIVYVIPRITGSPLLTGRLGRGRFRATVVVAARLSRKILSAAGRCAGIAALRHPVRARPPTTV